MTVYVVTDSTSCLPSALAAEYGITVLDIHTRGRLRPADTGDAPASGTDRSDRASAGVADAAGTADATAGTPDSAADGPVGSAESAESAGTGGDGTAAAAGGDRSTGTGSPEIPDSSDNSDKDSDSTAGTATDGDAGEDPTTAGLGPLELTAAYARLLERGGDDGVVAIHLSRELSSTWSSAVQAAAVFDGRVNVLDTRSAGMVLGQAAIAAARRAAAGASLAECTAAAQHVLDGANVWLYVHRLDALARGGRLSTAQRLLSTALAIKPILHLSGGKIELAAKTRTQTKAMHRLVTFTEDAYRELATPAAGGTDTAGDAPEATTAVASPTAPATDTADPAAPTGTAPARDSDGTTTPVTGPDTAAPDAGADGAPAGQDRTDGTGTSDAPEPADAPEKTPVSGEDTDRPRVFTFGGDHEFRLRKRREEPVPLRDLPPVAMHLDIHQAGYPELAEELRETLRADLPESVVISVVDLSPALMVHTGPEAVGITLVHD